MSMADNLNTNRVIYATAGAAAGVVLATVIAPLVLPPAGFGALRPSWLAAMIQPGMGYVGVGVLPPRIGTGEPSGAIAAIPMGVSAVGAGLGAALGAVLGAAAGWGPDDEDPDEEGPNDEAEGGDAGDKAGEGPVGEDAVRTGPNRCPECQRRRVRLCQHPA